MNRTQRSPLVRKTKINVAMTCRAVTQAEENYSKGVPPVPAQGPSSLPEIAEQGTRVQKLLGSNHLRKTERKTIRSHMQGQE